jgi:hypothetical protein
MDHSLFFEELEEPGAFVWGWNVSQLLRFGEAVMK